MKRLAFFFAVIAMSFPSAAISQNENDTTAQQFLKAWTGALQSGDIDRMMSLYEDSNDVIAIQSTGKICKGIIEIRKEYESAFNEVTFEKAELQNIMTRQNGDTVWTTCRFRADTNIKRDHSVWTLEILTSFVLKHTNNQWKIVLEQSTPIAGVPRVRPRKESENDGRSLQ